MFIQCVLKSYVKTTNRLHGMYIGDVFRTIAWNIPA